MCYVTIFRNGRLLKLPQNLPHATADPAERTSLAQIINGRLKGPTAVWTLFQAKSVR